MRPNFFPSLRAPAALAVAALLSACAAVGPDYRRPEAPLPAAFPGEAAAAVEAPAAAVPADWWTLLRDPQLDALVDAALARNADLLQAAARVEQADAQLREAGSALFPSVNGSANGSRARRFVNGQAVTGTNLGLSLSTAFELDFWGRLRRADEAARAQALASRHARDTVRLTVAALTAQAYLSLRSLDEQIAITRETLRTRDEQLRVLRSRVEAGVSGRLDLDQSQVLRADAAVQLRELQRQRALAASQLGLLAGEPGLQVGEGRLGQPVPAAPPAGLPSSLLLRRPDVQQAEQRLVAANALVGVARAAMFPSLSLTGALGGESPELSNLLDAGSRIWSLGFGLTVPLFNGGRLAARTDQAWAVQREAVAAYQGAVQSAFQDTADALATLRAARESEADVQQRWQASANALKLAQMRYDAGYSAYVELLDAQRTANAARLEVVRNRAAQLAGTVALWRALGGGWSADAEDRAAAAR
ncbi:efflux transporter outer membrane subunit [Caldimonas tepidiphila]|uniref:efflux transporter outer membrane subunit n=1 Tax=Caldimonas tepidiphila TaxID=2315841 RepID=UPI000E5AC011|nr:efflux transporter outer membrane subunit [Caldimonas tepidiphila]